MNLSSKHLSRLCIHSVLCQGHPWVNFFYFQPHPPSSAAPYFLCWKRQGIINPSLLPSSHSQFWRPVVHTHSNHVFRVKSPSLPHKIHPRPLILHFVLLWTFSCSTTSFFGPLCEMRGQTNTQHWGFMQCIGPCLGQGLDHTMAKLCSLFYSLFYTWSPSYLLTSICFSCWTMLVPVLTQVL